MSLYLKAQEERRGWFLLLENRLGY